MADQVLYNIQQLDDGLFADQVLSFEGGQVSHQRTNLLADTQSALLYNTDIDRYGTVRTRRGTQAVGASPPSAGHPIQGFGNLYSPNATLFLAAANGLMWQWNGTAWSQVLAPSVANGSLITFGMNAQVILAGNNFVNIQALGPPYAPLGKVVIGDIVRIFAPDLTQIFPPSGSDFTVISTHETAGVTDEISFTPSTTTVIPNGSTLQIYRAGSVNHVGGYPAGTTAMNVTVQGIILVGQIVFVLASTTTYTVTAKTDSGGNTISVVITPGLVIPSYSSANTTKPVIFASGVDQIFWTDGRDYIFAWTGVNALTQLTGNTSLSPTNQGPMGPIAMIWFADRLIAAGPTWALKSGGVPEPDTLYFSDFLDPTRWDTNFQNVRVGGGESDPITGLVPWSDFNFVVFKQRSIYVVNTDPAQNVTQDPTELVFSYSIKPITKAFGCTSPQSAVQIGGPGGDIFFLATDNTVRSIKRTVAAASQQEIGIPVSKTPNGGIQDILDQINAAAAKTAVAVYHDNRYILFFPFLSSAYPNRGIVFNTLLQSWVGTWDTWNPTAFEILTGDLLLQIGQQDGTVQTWQDFIAEEAETANAYKDFVSSGGTGGTDIFTQVITKSFFAGTFYNRKTGYSAELEFFRSSAVATIYAILDGVVNTGTPVRSGYATTPPGGGSLPFSVNTVNRMADDLQRYGQYREVQLQVQSTAGKLQIRSLKAVHFVDTIVEQT